MNQKAWSFDKATMTKILKGALISATAAAGIAVCQYVGALDISNPALAGLIAWAVPTLTNAIREWAKGY